MVCNFDKAENVREERSLTNPQAGSSSAAGKPSSLGAHISNIGGNVVIALTQLNYASR